jgi:hypothetical protein
VRKGAAQSLGLLSFSEEVRGKILVTGLREELQTDHDVRTQWAIIDALGAVGSPAANAVQILSNLESTNLHTITRATIALGRIEPENDRWINELIGLLDSNLGLAAWELGRKGKQAIAAVPRLKKMAMESQDPATRIMAATAVWRIDHSSPNPIQSIVDQLSYNGKVQYVFIDLLGVIGPDAKATVPTLLSLRYGHGDYTRDSVNRALEMIAPEHGRNPWLHVLD